MNRLIFIILIVLLVVSVSLALRVGSGDFTWTDFFYTILHPSDQNANQMIIWLHRFPRVIAALLVGAGLAASGCVLQGLLRNPLAEPYTLGISGGAAFGAGISMILLPAVFGIWSLPLSAFLGALLAIGLIYLIASKQHFSITGLILTGVILSFIFSSIVLLLFTLANPLQFSTAFFWLIGTFSGLKTELVNIIPFFIVIGIGVIYFFGRDLDAMSLGDEKALHLGVEANKTRKILFIVTSLIVGVCIATAGMIGFVGLIIPHLMRLIIGPKHKPLIMASALAGASFLVICDMLARTILSRYGQELPVGVITGIIGGLFFMSFLLRNPARTEVKM
jgi:iron complex transport system permease protein